MSEETKTDPRAPSHVLTNAHALSPHLVVTAVNTKYGANTVDWWGVLDPARAERQMNAAAGATVFHATGALSRGLSDPHWAPDDLGAKLGL